MSRSFSAEFAMRQALREKIFKDRVRTKTGQFYERYESIYQTLCAQGADDLLPAEMKRLRRDLDAITALLEEDPVEARDRSFAVGGYIHSLTTLAHAAQDAFVQKEHERRAALQRERATQSAAHQKAFFDAIATMDPVTAHFAAQELAELRQEMATGTMNEEAIASRVADIASRAEAQADAWKEQTRIDHQAEAVAAQVQDIAETLPSQETKTVAALREKLRAIREKAGQSAAPVQELQQEIQEAGTESDELAVDEDVRRACTESVVKKLQTLGFAVSCQLRDDNVEVYAQTPSGKRATFQLSKNGKIQYTFDHYTGSECLKDIEVVKANLDQCYGIHFSNERVLWQTPDRLSMNAYDKPNTNADGRM